VIAEIPTRGTGAVCQKSDPRHNDAFSSSVNSANSVCAVLIGFTPTCRHPGLARSRKDGIQAGPDVLIKRDVQGMQRRVELFERPRADDRRRDAGGVPAARSSSAPPPGRHHTPPAIPSSP
jgi:hypothetical protein